MGAFKVGDYAAALAILTPLARQGNADAQAGLGYMFDLGKGFAKNYTAAAKWFRMAAKKGEPYAQRL